MPKLGDLVLSWGYSSAFVQ